MILVEVVRNRKTNLLSNKMLSELRSKIFSKLLSLKMKDFEKFPSSDIYTRLTVDAENVKTLFSEDIPVIVNDIMNIIFMLVAMFIINVKLAFIGTAIIIVFGISEFFIIKTLKNIHKETVKKRDLQSKEYSETYNKNKLTKFFGIQSDLATKTKEDVYKVNNLLSEELKLRNKYILVDSFPWPVSMLIEATAIYVVLYYVLNIESGISLGTVYVFLYYIRQCFSPVKELFNQIESIQTSQVSLERINSILLIKEKEDINMGLNVEHLKGDIKFNNVSFAYDKQNVLRNISFKINSGEKTAIVGKTRCRKNNYYKNPYEIISYK